MESGSGSKQLQPLLLDDLCYVVEDPNEVQERGGYRLDHYS
jgi:hypothetical protein